MMNQSEVAMLLEAWQKIVEYIPAKDRLEAARAYVTLLDDHGLDDQALEEFKGNDDYLEEAITEHYDDLEESEDEEGSAYNDEAY